MVVMDAKAFYKSKTFWAGVMSIVTGISIIAQRGHVDGDAIAAIVAGVGAIVGRAQATAPLALTDHKDPTAAKWDALNGK
jgi:hypothetical protein